jgi:hypothetical protein
VNDPAPTAAAKPRKPRRDKRTIELQQQDSPERPPDGEWRDWDVKFSSVSAAWAHAEKNGKPGDTFRVAFVTQPRTIKTQNVLE